MNVFDILGPVMIGPSSSHTAGADRIGKLARELLGAPPVKAEILLSGSFARTYKGHGTDRALIAGIMGFDPDDIRLREAPRLAAEAGISVTVSTGDIENAHPNTAKIHLWAADGNEIVVIGSSIGGGNVLVTEVNGMSVSITGQYTTLIVLHEDRPGVIAEVSEVLAAAGVNIADFRVSRKVKGGDAVMTIETDGCCGQDLNRVIARLPGIYSSTMIKPL